MAPAHFGFQLSRYLLRGELPPLFSDHQLEGEMEQEITQFSPDRPRVSFGQRVIQLEHLLHQVRPKCLAGLCPIPGAPVPEIPHGCQSTSKR
jgi:hypothetical protein